MQEFLRWKRGTRQSPSVVLACSLDFSVEESTASCTRIAADPSFRTSPSCCVSASNCR